MLKIALFSPAVCFRCLFVASIVYTSTRTAALHNFVQNALEHYTNLIINQISPIYSVSTLFASNFTEPKEGEFYPLQKLLLTFVFNQSYIFTIEDIGKT